LISSSWFKSNCC